MWPISSRSLARWGSAPSERTVSERPGLSSPDKRLWPGFTKADLYDYYTEVADRLLSHLADRPVTFKRYPRGVGAEGFFQKDLPDSAPESIGRFRDWSDSAQRTVTYALLSSVDDLRWCAHMNVVELHVWLARVDAADRPDAVVFDLDPGAREVPVVEAAHWLRDVLDDLGLSSIVKTSGKKGLHLHVPIERRYGFSEVRGLGLAIARLCCARHPDELTVEMRKDHREGRLLIDWSRNARGQTTISAWSPRAVEAATVSTPLRWHEVTETLDPAALTLETVVERDDPWADPPRPQRLERTARALAELGYPPVDVSPRGKRPIETRLAEAIRR